MCNMLPVLVLFSYWAAAHWHRADSWWPSIWRCCSPVWDRVWCERGNEASPRDDGSVTLSNFEHHHFQARFYGPQIEWASNVGESVCKRRLLVWRMIKKGMPPLQLTRRLGECCELPSGIRGRVLLGKGFCRILMVTEHSFLHLFAIALSSSMFHFTFRGQGWALGAIATLPQRKTTPEHILCSSQ